MYKLNREMCSALGCSRKNISFCENQRNLSGCTPCMHYMLFQRLLWIKETSNGLKNKIVKDSKADLYRRVK